MEPEKKNLIDRTMQKVKAHHYVQRMARISQLGTIPHFRERPAYPRLVHSLGTEHIAKRVCERLLFLSSSLKPPIRMTWYHCLVVRLAALLHDIGHLPFSHQFDQFLRWSEIQGCHERRSVLLVRRVVSDCVREGIEVECHPSLCLHVESIIIGRPDPDLPAYLTNIINADEITLDLDRLDYLPRDAEYFLHGMGKYWKTMQERIISSISISEDGASLWFDALLTTNFLKLRSYLKNMCYVTSQETNIALSRALQNLASDQPEMFMNMNAHKIHQIHCLLSEENVVKEMVKLMSKKAPLK